MTAITAHSFYYWGIIKRRLNGNGTRTVYIYRQSFIKILYKLQVNNFSFNFIWIHHNIAINVTVSHQFSNILLFGITRLIFSQERIKICQYIYDACKKQTCCGQLKRLCFESVHLDRFRLSRQQLFHRLYK